MVEKIKLYFLHIAQKRYLQHKNNKIIDNILFIIVNTLHEKSIKKQKSKKVIVKL